MKGETVQHQPQPGHTEDKKPFEEPKLTYLTPKLTERGNVQEVTLQGFFGSFSP